MHAKKLEKIVKNIENTFAQQSNSHKIAKDDKNLIKQAQNLIKNGPKNIQLKSNASNKTQRTPLSSGLAPQLKLDRHFNNISLNKSLNKSLDKSQESHISTITKATNRNISPTFSQKSSKQGFQRAIKAKTTKENQFGALSTLEIKKKTQLNDKTPPKTVVTPQKTSIYNKTSPKTPPKILSKTPPKTLPKTPLKTPTPKTPSKNPLKTPPKNQASNKTPKKLHDKTFKTPDNFDYRQTLSRFEVYNQLKDQNLLSLRFQSRKKELSQNSSRSYLSKNSSKILKEKQYKPPFKKTEEVLSHKRQTIFALQEKVEKEQKIKNPEPSFKPNIINNHGKEGVRRTKEEFYHEMMEWMRHKIDGQTRKKLEIRKKEEIEITFHPLINYKSNSIANESNREKIIVEERLCKWKEKLDEKRKNMILMNKSSDFIHKISDNSEILAQQYREKMKHKQIEKKNGKEKDEEYSNINEDLLENNTRKNFSVSFNLENNTVEEINDEKFKNSEEGGMEKDENDSNNESVI